MEKLILVINPGSTSTKIGLFKNLDNIVDKSIRHSNDELKEFKTIYDQKDFRKACIVDFLKENNFEIEEIDVFVGRGGLLHPLKSGTYLVNDKMIEDLKYEKYGSHASNLGAVLAYDLAKSNQKLAFISDPVVVDELLPISRVTGLKGMEKICIFHALNQKAVAKRYANETNQNYSDLNLIVVHLGGGISVGFHNHGQVVDVNNALNGDGPFSPERSGSLPIFQLIDLCFSNKYSISEIKKMLVGNGGLVSYLGTNNGIEISKRIDNGDKEAKFYLEAMGYQVIKEIGAIYFAAKGKVGAIILTGGLVYNKHLISYIKEYLDPIQIPILYPGEDELLALVEAAMRIINHEENIQEY